MPIDGYFDTIFAVDGDLTVIPDPTQGSGTVSYQQGFPVGYSTPVGSGGFNFPRYQFNQLMNDITSAIQNWQQNTIAPFITTTMNGGTPYSYSQYNMVLYGGVGYISLVNSNTDTPPSAKWTTIPFGSTSFYSGGVSTGSANVQVVATLSPAGFSLSTDGSTVCCTAGFTNTGATTFALGGTAATAVKKWNGSAYVALTGGEIHVDETIFLSRNVTESCLVLTDAPTLGNIAALNTDGTNFTSSGGNLAFGSAPALPSTATATTQAAGTNTTQLATTAFVYGALSASTNGYTKLPNGLILQWGSAANTTTSYSFATTFPNACLQVLPQFNWSAGGVNAPYVQVVSMSTSGFTAGTPSGVGSLTWIAIGY
jgi:hypothetical protein